MVTNRYINAVIAVLTALAVLACGIAVVFSRSYGEAEETRGLTMEYETALFGTEEPPVFPRSPVILPRNGSA